MVQQVPIRAGRLGIYYIRNYSTSLLPIQWSRGGIAREVLSEAPCPLQNVPSRARNEGTFAPIPHRIAGISVVSAQESPHFLQAIVPLRFPHMFPQTSGLISL